MQIKTNSQSINSRKALINRGESELPDGFVLDMPEQRVRRLSTGWLLLALGSLVVGGLLTIVIVLSRTPFIQDALPWLDIFHTASSSTWT